ncbi:ribonuclease H, partial [Klebsiella michiganensis]
MVAPTTIERLRLITTRQELAALLNLKPHFLTNILYRNGVNTQYSQFRIPKKDGSFRLISSPSSKLNDIQKRLA